MNEEIKEIQAAIEYLQEAIYCLYKNKIFRIDRLVRRMEDISESLECEIRSIERKCDV